MADTKLPPSVVELTKDGKSFIVSADKKWDYLAEGYDDPTMGDGGRPASSLGMDAATFGETALNSGTLGATNVLADVGSGLAGAAADSGAPRAAGPGIDAPLADANPFMDAMKENQADRLQRQEDLGSTGMVAANILGAVAPTLLSGGATAGLRGAAALAPAALMETAGTRVAAKILSTEAAKAAARSTVGRLATGAVARGVGGALEGGVGAATTTAGDLVPQIIENPGEAAEAIWEATKTGAGLGAAVGGTFGTVEAGMRQAGARTDQLLKEVAEPNYTPAMKAITADEAVAANAVRPMRAQDLPPPERSIAGDLSQKYYAGTGGAAKVGQETATLGRDTLTEFLETKRLFNDQASVATKRLFNEERINNHLAGQVTDIVDPEDAARLAGIEGAVSETRTRLGSATEQMAALEARRASALSAQAEARAALDVAEAPAVRKTTQLNRETGLLEEVDSYRVGAKHETKALREALNAASDEVKATEALFRAARDEADEAGAAFGAASKARGGQPIDTSDVVRGTQFDQPTFSIGDKGNEMATARARLDMDDELLTVDTIDTREAVRGKGLGTKLYAAMAEHADANGRKLASDVTPNRSPNAEMWWKKRVAEGKAQFDQGKDRYILTGKLEAPGGATPRKMTATEHELRGGLDEMIQQTRRFGATEVAGKEADAVAQLEKQLTSHRDQVVRALKAGDFGRAHNLVDQGLKHAVRDFAKSTKSKVAADYAKAMYEIPKGLAESARIWGDEVAAAQKLANPTLSAAAAATQGAHYRKFFSKGNEVEPTHWIPDDEVNSESVGALMKNMGDAGQLSSEEAMRTGLRAEIADMANRSKAWGSPDAQVLADRAAKLATRFEDAMDVAAQVNKDAAGYQQMLRTGQLLAGTVAAGTALANASSMDAEKLTQYGVAAIAGRWLLGAAGRYKGNGIQRAISGAAKLVKGTNKALERGSMATARVAGTERGRTQALEQAKDLTDPARPGFQKLVNHAEMINRVSPGMGDAMLQQGIKEAQYIKQYMPQAASPAQFAPPARPTRTAAMQLERVLAAVSNPPLTFGRITDGMATKQDLDAMRQLYPQQYQRLVDEIMVQLETAPAKRRSRSEELYLSAVVGQPLTPALMNIGEVQKRAQAATYNAAQEGKPEGDGKNGADGVTARAPISIDTDVYASRGDQVLTGA